jgi:hypothetical protein
MTTSQMVPVTGNRPTGGPGIYFAMVSGLTITLETWAHWPDASKHIMVKNAPGVTNTTVLAPQVPGGLIDGLSAALLPNANESLTFTPFQNGVTWSVSG